MSYISDNSLALVPGAPGAIPTTFRTTAGDAIPALNILTMTNGANITLSGAGSAITTALNADISITSATATNFYTSPLTTGSTLSAATWTGDGTDVNISMTITPKGTGNLTVTTGDVNVPSGNLLLPLSNSAGTLGVIKFGTDPALSIPDTNLYVGAGAGRPGLTGATKIHNVYVGEYAGHWYLLPNGGSGGQADNVAIGYYAMGSGDATWNDNETKSVAIGAYAMQYAGGNEQDNVAIGYRAGRDLHFNSNSNTLIGSNCAYDTGDQTVGNTVVGANNATAWTTGEKYNIILGTSILGTAGESNKLRIGNATGTGNGELDAAYICGIYGATCGVTAGVTLTDSVNKLSSLSGTAGQVLQGGTKPAFSTATYPSTVAKGDVLVASANNIVGVINDVTNAGYVLTANAAAAPTFQALPAGATYASDAETLAGTVTNKAVAPSNLKAKLGLQTVHALPVGNSDSLALNWLAVGLNGQTIMGSTGADCGWTSSPQFGGSVTATNDINTTAGNLTASNGGLIVSNNAASTADAQVEFRKTRTSGIITSGDGLGTMRFEGYDGVSFISGSKITSTNSGTVAVNRIAGDLKFYTHPDSVVALPSEPLLRMTIASTGAVTIANPDSGTGLTVSGSGITCASGAITATLGNVVVTSGNLTLPATSSTVGQITINSSPVLHTYGGEPGADSRRNLWVGKDAGNFTCNTAVNYGGNVGIGCLALRSVWSAGDNVGIGNYSLNALSGQANSGYRNVAIGIWSLRQLVGADNVADHGSYNVAVGYGAGSALTGNEYSNIFIGNYAGVAGQNNRLQIGSATGTGAGQLNAAYICGIYNTAVGATAGVVLAGSTNQIGSISGAANTVFVGGTKPSFTATPQCTDLTLTGLLNLPATSSTAGQITIASNVVFHTYGGEPGSDAWRNLWVGKDAGNFSCSTAANYGGNIGIGCLAMRSLTNGQENFALGYKSLNALTGAANSGYRNVAIGNYSLYRLVGGDNTPEHGSYNTAIGYNAGGNYTGNEYGNIVINYAGVAGQNNRLQIGASTGSGAGAGVVDTAWICGIYGRTPSGTQNICLVDSNNQLGSVATLPASLGGKMAWTTATANVSPAVVNTGYLIKHATPATELVVTLPTTSALYDEIEINGYTAGLWKLQSAAGQTIHYGAFDTTPGATGYLEATGKYDCVKIRCVVANAEWLVVSEFGTLNYF
jgi:hypothetical protein